VGHRAHTSVDRVNGQERLAGLVWAGFLGGPGRELGFRPKAAYGRRSAGRQGRRRGSPEGLPPGAAARRRRRRDGRGGGGTGTRGKARKGGFWRGFRRSGRACVCGEGVRASGAAGAATPAAGDVPQVAASGGARCGAHWS
jgi:hypothetical protein